MRHSTPHLPAQHPAVVHRTYRTDAGCPLLVMPVAQQPNGVLHSHNLAELVVVRSGCGVHRLGQRDWPIAAGEVFLIPPGAPHRYSQCQNLRLDNFLFEPLDTWLPVTGIRDQPGWRSMFQIQDLERPGGRLRLQIEELREVSARSQRVQTEITHARPGWASVASGEFLALIGMLVRWWPLRAQITYDPHLTELLPWIESNSTRALSTFGFARRLGITQRTVQRLFRDQLGCTPKQYLERVRLDHALRLFADTQRRRVGEVARLVGFQDASYFARRWKARFGHAPRDSR